MKINEGKSKIMVTSNKSRCANIMNKQKTLKIPKQEAYYTQLGLEKGLWGIKQISKQEEDR